MGLGRKDIDEPKADNCCQFKSERLSVHWIRNTFVARIVYLYTLRSHSILCHIETVSNIFPVASENVNHWTYVDMLIAQTSLTSHSLSNSMCLAGIHIFFETRITRKKSTKNERRRQQSNSIDTQLSTTERLTYVDCEPHRDTLTHTTAI